MFKSQTEQKKRSWQDNPKNEHPQLPHYSFQHQQLENGHFYSSKEATIFIKQERHEIFLKVKHEILSNR